MNYLKYVIDNIRTEDYTPEEYYWKVVAILKEFGSYHSMVTGMTVKGTSTGRFTKPAPEPHCYPRGDGTTVVDFSTPSNNIKAEDLAVRERNARKTREFADNYARQESVRAPAPNIVHSIDALTAPFFNKLARKMTEDAVHTGLAIMKTTAEGIEPMTQEEMNEGPMPEWAIGRAKGDLVLGAQLPTRDGRHCGNAHIINIVPDAITDETLYYVLTDAGSTISNLNAEEMDELFYPPVWRSDLEDVNRKFQPRTEPNPKTQCCDRAASSNGWHHNEDCPNWVLTY